MFNTIAMKGWGVTVIPALRRNPGRLRKVNCMAQAGLWIPAPGQSGDTDLAGIISDRLAQTCWPVSGNPLVAAQFAEKHRWRNKNANATGLPWQGGRLAGHSSGDRTCPVAIPREGPGSSSANWPESPEWRLFHPSGTLFVKTLQTALA